MSTTLSNDTQAESWDPRDYLDPSEIIRAIHLSFGHTFHKWTSQYRREKQLRYNDTDSGLTIRKRQCENWNSIAREVTAKVERYPNSGPLLSETRKLRIPCLTLPIMSVGAEPDGWDDVNAFGELFDTHTGLCQKILTDSTYTI